MVAAHWVWLPTHLLLSCGSRRAQMCGGGGLPTHMLRVNPALACLFSPSAFSRSMVRTPDRRRSGMRDSLQGGERDGGSAAGVRGKRLG